MSFIREAIARLVAGQSLEAEAAEAAMTDIMSGQATPAQVAGFLVALRLKGETPDEVAGCARAMRRSAVRVETPDGQEVLDVVGTGGDGSHTINVSTAAAIVAASAGVPVAKHGNRSVSSRCGSADVLEALGVPLELDAAQAGRCLAEAGVAFLFAPAFHPAMRHAQGPRRELGIRTVFNLLGALTNPAGARQQLVGVYEPRAVELAAGALQRLGARRALVVHGRDGLDELSISGPSVAAWVEPDRVQPLEVDPEALGLPRAPREAIAGGDAQANAQALLAVLSGQDRGPRRDVVVLNAGAALWVAGKAEDLRDGLRLAASCIDSGQARAKLEDLVRAAQQVARDGARSGASGPAPGGARP